MSSVKPFSQKQLDKEATLTIIDQTDTVFPWTLFELDDSFLLPGKRHTKQKKLPGYHHIVRLDL